MGADLDNKKIIMIHGLASKPPQKATRDLWRKTLVPGESWRINHQYTIRYPGGQMAVNVGGTLGTPVANHIDTTSSSAGRWYVRTWEVSLGPAGTRTVTVRGEARDALVFSPPTVDVTTQIMVN